MKYAIFTRLKEMYRNAITYTATLSITIGLFFFLIAVGYTFQVDKEIKRVQSSLLLSNAAQVKLKTPNQSNEHGLITVIEQSDVLLESASFKTIDSVYKIDRNWGHLFRVDFMSESEWQAFHTSSNLFLIDRYLAEEYNVEVGDVLYVENKEFICMKIIDHYTLSFRVIFGEGANLEWPRPVEYVHYLSESLPIEKGTEESQNVADTVSLHLEILEHRRVMVFFVLLLFMSIVIFNTLAVNSGLQDINLRNDAIKHLLGESKTSYYVRSVAERMILYSAAYHFACIIYLVFYMWIPINLRSELNIAVYLLGYSLTLLFTTIAPVIEFFVSMKAHSKALLRI